MVLPIIYQDQHLIIINKPAGLLVHRTKMDFGETESAVNFLRNQLGVKVFPVHRLDKPTSGVLIFALSADVARIMSKEFIERRVDKKYLAVVRGIPEQYVVIDYPLKEELDEISDKYASQNKPAKEAITHVKLLATIELPIQVDKYSTSLYSLVEAKPITGRKHQIRRHLRHINNPIIGDINHGSGVHNRFFETEFKIRKLLLACTEISFVHPKSNTQMVIKASLPEDFINIMKKLGWSDHVV
jgi:tRNA pseudouridine65 synthase